MSKKPDTATALASILKAKRGEELPPAPLVTASAEPDPGPAPAPAPEPPPAAPPSPAPSLPPPVAEAPKPETLRPFRRGGKSSDKANYSQFSVYLRRDTRKKVGRALDDLDSEQDFSELVQSLLEQWLKSNT